MEKWFLAGSPSGWEEFQVQESMFSEPHKQLNVLDKNFCKSVHEIEIIGSVLDKEITKPVNVTKNNNKYWDKIISSVHDNESISSMNDKNKESVHVVDIVCSDPDSKNLEKGPGGKIINTENESENTKSMYDNDSRSGYDSKNNKCMSNKKNVHEVEINVAGINKETTKPLNEIKNINDKNKEPVHIVEIVCSDPDIKNLGKGPDGKIINTEHESENIKSMHGNKINSGCDIKNNESMFKNKSLNSVHKVEIFGSGLNEETTKPLNKVINTNTLHEDKMVSKDIKEGPAYTIINKEHNSGNVKLMHGNKSNSGCESKLNKSIYSNNSVNSVHEVDIKGSSLDKETTKILNNNKLQDKIISSDKKDKNKKSIHFVEIVWPDPDNSKNKLTSNNKSLNTVHKVETIGPALDKETSKSLNDIKNINKWDEKTNINSMLDNRSFSSMHDKNKEPVHIVEIVCSDPDSKNLGKGPDGKIINTEHESENIKSMHGNKINSGCDSKSNQSMFNNKSLNSVHEVEIFGSGLNEETTKPLNEKINTITLHEDKIVISVHDNKSISSINDKNMESVHFVKIVSSDPDSKNIVEGPEDQIINSRHDSGNTLHGNEINSGNTCISSINDKNKKSVHIVEIVCSDPDNKYVEEGPNDKIINSEHCSGNIKAMQENTKIKSVQDVKVKGSAHSNRNISAWNEEDTIISPGRDSASISSMNSKDKESVHFVEIVCSDPDNKNSNEDPDSKIINSDLGRGNIKSDKQIDSNDKDISSLNNMNKDSVYFVEIVCSDPDNKNSNEGPDSKIINSDLGRGYIKSAKQIDSNDKDISSLNNMNKESVHFVEIVCSDLIRKNTEEGSVNKIINTEQDSLNIKSMHGNKINSGHKIIFSAPEKMKIEDFLGIVDKVTNCRNIQSMQEKESFNIVQGLGSIGLVHDNKTINSSHDNRNIQSMDNKNNNMENKGNRGITNSRQEEKVSEFEDGWMFPRMCMIPSWEMNLFNGKYNIASIQQDDEKKMEASLDTSQYRPDELSVSVSEGTVSVEGKHEEKAEDGSKMVSRQFVRKYTLPAGAEPQDVSSNLSSDGSLLISAGRTNPIIEVKIV